MSLLLPLLACLTMLGFLPPTSPDLFDEIYAKSRDREKSLQTMRARFVETTVSTLLVEPLVARGTVIAKRPLRVRLEYQSPEKKVVILDERRLTVVWTDRAEREDLALAALAERVDRYFTRASLKELRAHFEISAVPDAQSPGSYRVEMVPKRKQIREGLERLELWLNGETFLPFRMRMTFPGGDSKTLSFEALEVNVEAPEALFER